MKFLDLFSGIGGFRLGLEQAGHECVGHVEFDKYAQKSYEAMYSKGREEEYAREFNGSDITTINGADLPHAHIWTFGAPCQDFSIAGKREGLEGNRSSLVQEVFRIYRETTETNRPEWLIYENVKGMFSSNGGRDFLSIIDEMGALGFDIEWQLFNSKNHGVPQNRERVYVIGHLRGGGRRNILPIQGADGQIEENDIKVINNPDKIRKEFKFIATNRILDTTGISPTLDTMTGGGREPKIAIREATKKGYAIAEEGDSINFQFPDSKTRRGRVGKQIANTLEASGVNQGVLVSQRDGVRETNKVNKAFGSMQKNRAENNGDISPTLTSAMGVGGGHVPMLEFDNFRIRKLTPKECFRLQGFPDEYFDRAASVNSNSQLYKQAGNAVTVNVVRYIGELLNDLV